MNRIAKSLVAVMAGLALIGSAWAADPVVVNVDEGNPPFMFSKDGQAAGVYSAVIAAAFARMGVPVTIEAEPWKRAIAEMDDAKAGVGGIYKNDERAKKYDFSEPMFTENTAVYFNKAKPVDFKTVADLNGKKVGVIRGWSYGDAFDAARKENKFNVEEVNGDKPNFQKLSTERLDVVLAVEESGTAEIAAGKLTVVEQSGVYLASNKAHLAFAKSAKHTELLANFNKAIAAMKSDGSLDKIVAKELSK